MSSRLTVEIELAKASVIERSHPGRTEYYSPENNRKIVFQETESWKQISLEIYVGNGWEKRIGLFYQPEHNKWSILTAVDLGDGTTSIKSYNDKGLGILSSTVMSAPNINLLEMKRLIYSAGIPTESALPRTIDFEKTALLYLEQIKRGDFSDPTLVEETGDTEKINS